jgi:quinoprotein glucose dehydrogenase
MPSFRGYDIIEADMWGVTPLDQLWCRVKFREARYDGPQTPPGLTPSIDRPASTGSSNWGSVAIDKSRGIGIFNTSYLLNDTRLMTRAEADKIGLKRLEAHVPLLPGGKGRPQEGTPYAVRAVVLMSPLEVPCNRPPYGLLSAVDLATGKLIWSQPFGTARDIGPWGMRSMLPWTIGTFNVGGAVVTKGDILFIGATQDRAFRAYETATGRLLWQADLPGGGFATPMTYLSPESGRQFVVIAASGGSIPGIGGGTYVVAYALPKAPSH